MSTETEAVLELQPIRDWWEWLDLWEDEKHFEARLGLLHVGFDVPRVYRHEKGEQVTEVPGERIIFYLGVADGWRDRLGRDDKESARKRALTRKAMDILWQRFFRPRSDAEKARNFSSRPRFAGELVKEGVLEAVLHFFRLDPNSSLDLKLSNLPRGLGSKPHYASGLYDFLFEMVKFCWTFYRSDRRTDEYWDDEGLRKLFRENRCRFVDILYGIDRIDWLVSLTKHISHMEDLEERLDSETLAHLKKRVLSVRRGLPSPERRSLETHYRATKTVEEAAWAGSRGAYVYLLIQAWKQQQQKFEDELKHAKELAAAEAKLRRLKKKGAKKKAKKS